MNNSFADITSEFASIKSLVIGDVMLDTHFRGSSNRMSPEAPVPVLEVNSVEHKAGGAGNVASNLISLNASVSLHAVCGMDPNAQILKQLLLQQGIQPKNILESAYRKTTQKIRLLNGNSHMLRCDLEDTFDLTAQESSDFLKNLQLDWDLFQPQVIFLQDYNKGVCSPEVISYAMQRARKENIPIIVDPKSKNFFLYLGATLFKPNFKEAAEALGFGNDFEKNPENMSKMASLLIEKIHFKNLLITLSEKGVFYCDDEMHQGLWPAQTRKIIDVSGAGDTVLAVAGLCLASNKSLSEVAWYANLAGGLACEYSGVQALSASEFSAAIRDCA